MAKQSQILISLLVFFFFSSFLLAQQTEPMMLIMGDESFSTEKLDYLKQAVVKLEVSGQDGEWVKTGAGVIVGKDAEVDMVFVATAYHTLFPPEDAETPVDKIKVWFKQKDYFPFARVEILKYNDLLDVALLGIFDVSKSIQNGFIPLPTIKPNALGNAFAFGHSSFGDWEYDVTEFRPNYNCSTRQSDSQRFRLDESQSVEPGFSGGPVFMTVGSGENKQFGLVGLVVEAGEDCVNGVYMDEIRNAIMDGNPNYDNQLTDGGSGLAGGDSDSGNNTEPSPPVIDDSGSNSSSGNNGNSSSGQGAKILFVYNSLDYAKYVEQIEEFGYTVDKAIATSSALSAKNPKNYDLIIVEPTTGRWENSQTLNYIKNAKKPILGMGAGGAYLFGKMGLAINKGNTWTGTRSRTGSNVTIYVENSKMDIFSKPNKLSIPSSKMLTLYNLSGHIGLYKPSAGNKVTYIGRESNNDTHYSITKEGTNILWGFDGQANDLTDNGKKMLHNAINDLLNPSVGLGGLTYTISTPALALITGLAAPALSSPRDNEVFSHFPRKTKVSWKSVSGAASYVVELDCMHCCKSGSWCTDVGKTYRVEKNIKGNSYSFNWIGAQQGRWRVWAVDKNGKEGAKSAWRGFRYTK